jgi:hypothetical protein
MCTTPSAAAAGAAWPRATNPVRQNQERILVESYPFAAWKSLGLKPLPSKRRAKVSDLAEAYGACAT